MRHRSRPLFVTAAALGLAVCLCTSFSAVSVAEPVPVEPVPSFTLPPELDEFFRPPADVVVAAQPGQVLRARAIAPAFFGLAQLNVDAWQLLYRTTDSAGAPIATVTTVLKPRGVAPEGGRKLLSYQIAEDSAAQYCAASYVVQRGSLPIDTMNAAEIMIPIAAGIGQGWTVAIPDYQGPRSAYGASLQNAQATLDGIRAVTGFEPAQLSGPATPTALWGYSGGTIPSSFAAEYAQQYAPELNIVGVAAGGIAAADFPFILRFNNRGMATGLVSTVFAGLANEYPELRKLFQERVDPLGQFLVNSKYVLCHSIGAAIMPFWDYYGSFGGDPLEHPVARRIIEQNNLGQRTPTMPVLMFQAQLDEVLPIEPVDRLAGKYCAEGAPSVTYVRELLAEHGIGFLTSMPAAFAWLRDRLDGVPAADGCNITSTTTQVTDPVFQEGLLEIVPTAVRALVGEAIGVGK